MPTKSGLPKRGEVWEHTKSLPPDWIPHTVRFVVLDRGRGDRWFLRVYVPGVGKKLLVNPSAWFAKDELKYIGPAGPKTKAYFKL